MRYNGDCQCYILTYSYRKFRVYQLESHSFDCKLLYESPIMLSNSRIGEYMQIHNKYLILRYLMSDKRLIVNWMDRKYFQFEVKVGAKMIHP